MKLIFMHGGHTDQITDIAWSVTEKWTLASTAEDNVMQVWQPASTLTNADEMVVEGLE